MANILIIGGTGLISTPVTRELIAAGHKVTHYNRGQRDVRKPVRDRDANLGAC